MADHTSDIKITSSAPGVKQTFDDIKGSVQGVGDTADEATRNAALLRQMLLSNKDAQKPIDDLIKTIAGLDSQTDDATKSAGGLKKGIDDIGDSAAGAKTKLDDTTASTTKLKDEVDKTGDSAKSAEDKFRDLSEAGMKIGAVGAAGLLLSNHLIAAADEAENLELRLIAVLRAQNRLEDLPVINEGVQQITVQASLPDDDPVKAAAISLAQWGVATKDMIPLLTALQRQAESSGQSIETLAGSFGKAIGTGQTDMLKRSIGLFSEQEEAAIAAGYAISDQAGQIALIGAITATVSRRTGELGSSLSDTQKAANNAARAADDLATSMGKGAADSKKHVDNLVASLLQTAGANEEVAQSAGSFLFVGSAAMTAAGSVLTLVGTLSTIASAMTATGTLAAAWAVITGAVTTATAAVSAWAAAQIAAFSAALAAASTTAAGLNAVTLGVTAIGVAAALTVGYVAHAFGQHMGWFDNEQSFLERLTAGWYRLSDAILSTQNVRGAEFEQNAKDYAAEIEKNKAANAKAVLGGSKTQAQADEDNRNFERELSDKFARESARVGDDRGVVRFQETAARLSTPAAAAPASPVAAPQMTAAGLGAQSTLGLGSTLSGGTMGGGGGASDADDAQVIALQDAIKVEKNRYKKAALQNQLTLLQRQIKANKEAETEQKKAEREAERLRKEALSNAGLEASAAAAESTAGLDERGAGLQADATLAGSRDKREMNREMRVIRAQVKAGSLDNESGESQIAALKDAYEARDKARQADLAAQVAAIDAQRELISGRARAAGQEGKQAETTLRIAQSKANRALMLGQAKSEELRDEADELRASSAERAAEKQNTGTKAMRELAAAFAAGQLRGSNNSATATDGRMFAPASGNYSGGVADSAWAFSGVAPGTPSSFVNPDLGHRMQDPGIGYSQVAMESAQSRQELRMDAKVKGMVNDAVGDLRTTIEVFFRQDGGWGDAKRALGGG